MNGSTKNRVGELRFCSQDWRVEYETIEASHRWQGQCANAQIKAIRRQSRLATTLDEQNDLQQKLAALERKQRKQRQQIFEVEDQIAEKRDKLIDGLQKRMSQKTKTMPRFTIQWKVV